MSLPRRAAATVAGLPKHLTWLSTLKANALKRLAVLTGVPCSGTKPQLIHDVSTVLSSTQPPKANMSVLSIDMGIRNLAYVNFLVGSVPGSKASNSTTEVILNSWNRLAISEKKDGLEKESFDPKTYAAHAYDLVTHLLVKYRPTHILIERQRFRSGGGSAVQEWTIRVGVFEGMLWAVLRALKMEGNSKGEVEVEGVDPGRVVRYWLDGSEDAGGKTVRKKSKDGKIAKINLAHRLLRDALGQEGGVVARSKFTCAKTDDQVLAGIVGRFMSRASIKGRSGANGVNAPVEKKIDDLADCLLQGLAWLEWQEMRRRLVTEGWEGIASVEARPLLSGPRTEERLTIGDLEENGFVGKSEDSRKKEPKEKQPKDKQPKERQSKLKTPKKKKSKAEETVNL